MYLFEEYNKEDKLNLQNNNCLPLPNLEINPQKIELKSKSLEGHFKKAAGVSDNVICFELGRNVLLRGGNAVDAAISVSFCIGALNFPSAGLGGGFLMTFFRRFDGKCITIDALETIPPLGNNDTINPIEGYKSVSIPGVLHGLWTAYKRFGSGKITWNNLIMPTVHLLNEGFPASQALEKLSKKYSDKFNNETNKEIRNLFLNPTNGHHFREGQIIRNPLLAETYKKLALTNDPINLFYGNNGAIAKQIVEEFNQNGGLITHKDLQSYRSVIDEPYLNNFSDQKLVFCGPKTSSEFIENIIQKLENNSSEFGIPSKEEIQVDKEIGSSHITIVDSDGNTISMTHSINSPFGSLRRSPFLGILWNNQLINLNNSTDINLNNNQIGINNRLISSLSPISVYDRESRKIKLAIGASGGNELEAISSLSQVLTQIISFNKTLKEAIDMPRLFKNEFGIFYETGFPMKIIENLQNKGHKIKEMDYSSSLSLNGILREETDNILSAVNDYRLEDNNYPAGY
uniref:Gamma-glutamyltransferase n=1 Tax=Meloidogyne hapla TaxID=6305 RepID=A0A1I8B9B3_MELHA